MISLCDLQTKIIDIVKNASNKVATKPLNTNNSMFQIECDLKEIVLQKIVGAIMDQIGSAVCNAATTEKAIAKSMTIIQGLQSRVLDAGNIDNIFHELIMVACVTLLRGIPELLTMEDDEDEDDDEESTE